jgi:hypothetical protein
MLMPSKEQTHGQDKTSAKHLPQTPSLRALYPPVGPQHPASIIQRTNLAPRTLTHQNFLHLQRTVGNKYVGQLLSHGRARSSGLTIQTKLVVNETSNKYEQEADRVARQVVETLDAAASSSATRAPTGSRGDDETTTPAQLHSKRHQDAGGLCMMKPDIRRFDGEDGGAFDSTIKTSIQQAQGGGSPLDAGVRATMGGVFGVDFSAVKIHTDARAQQLNRSLQAKAFTTGQDIFFGQGVYAPGSREGRELIAHELTHVVQQGGSSNFDAPSRVARPPRRVARADTRSVPLIQKVTEKATAYRSSHQIKEMTLEQFDAYAQQQADWFAGPDIQETDRDGLRDALRLVREPGMLASSGRFEVGEVMELDGQARKHLETYNQLFESRQPFPMTRVAYAFTAVRRGEDLPKLISTFTAPVLSSAMDEAVLDQVTRGLEKMYPRTSWTDDLIAYYTGVSLKPYFEASNGADFASFVKMRQTDKKKPEAYENSPLKNRVRNFHRFRADALDQLSKNFQELSKKRPLTLILHSAIDHNGSFHRSEGLRDVIADEHILSLVLEGGERLEDYGRQIPELAQSYGIGGKIDQVLIAGHGGMRSVQLAGTPDAPDSIDLDENLEPTRKLYEVIFSHLDDRTQKVLGETEKVGNLHLRIVYDACLTNTNYVPLNEIPKTDQIEEIAVAVRKYIAEHPTLKVSTERMLQERNLNQWSVEGANAVTRASKFIDKETGRLGLSSDTDKFVVASKLEYVAHGIEPIGVFRAALECLTSTEQLVAETCQKQMQERAQSDSQEWRDIFIKAGFTLVLKNNPKDHAWLLSFLSNQSGNIEALLRTSSARVSELRQIAFLKEKAIPFFEAYKKSPVWERKYFRLVMLQVWMQLKNDAELMNEFLSTLEDYDCASLSPLIDIPSLTPLMDTLLTGERTPGRLRLSLLGVLSKEVVAEAKDFLLGLLGSSVRFPHELKLSEVLGGISTPDRIQERIGRPVPPLEEQVAEREGNVKLEGDTTNKEWVHSITKKGKITNVDGANLYTKPELTSGVIVHLPHEAALHLFGETANWFAAEQFTPEEKTLTGFLFYYDLKDEGVEQQDKTGDDTVSLYSSLEALADYDEGALKLLPETEVTVLEKGLGDGGDVVQVSIRRTEKRFGSAFVRKADVTLE